MLFKYQIFFYIFSMTLFTPIFFRIKSDSEKIYRALYLIPTLYIFWLVISLIYLESGYFSEEILLESFETNSWIRAYSLGAFFLLISRLVFASKFSIAVKSNLNKISFIENTILFLLFFYTITLFYSLPCNFCILDKKSFYMTSSFTLLLLKYLSLISFLYGYFYALFFDDESFKVKKWLVTVLIITVIYTLIILGHKFSQFIDFLFLFMLGFSAKLFKIKFSKLFITQALVIMCSLFLFTFFFYMNLNELNAFSLLELMFMRIFALQGGLTWAVDYLWLDQNNLISLTEFLNYIRNPISKNNYTIVYFMSKTIGIDRTQFLLQSGQIFSGAFPTVFLIFSKNFLICIIAISIYAIVLALLLIKIISEIMINRLFFVILLFLVSSPFISFLYNADISAFFTINYYLKVLIFLCFQILYELFKSRFNN